MRNANRIHKSTRQGDIPQAPSSAKWEYGMNTSTNLAAGAQHPKKAPTCRTVFRLVCLAAWLFLSFHNCAAQVVEEESVERLRTMYFDFEAGHIEGRKLLRKLPNSTRLRAWYVWNTARNEMAELAVREAEVMIEANEKDPWGWFALTGALGYSPHKKEIRQRAFEASTVFLRLLPTYVDSIWFHATALHRTWGRGRDRAVAYVDSHFAEARKPAGMYVIKGFILYWMSRRRGNESQFDESLRAFENARKLDPNFVASYYYPGLFLHDNGRHREAHPFLSRAAELSPQSNDVCRTYIRDLNSLPDWTHDEKRSEAVRVSRRLLEDRADYPTAHTVARSAYGIFGLDSLAIEIENHIIRQFPESSMAERSLWNEDRADSS
jgi:tetratricopeptide (TPR) repeat protein